jgi:tetratricopeptide (TPR) repeat protein
MAHPLLQEMQAAARRKDRPTVETLFEQVRIDPMLDDFEQLVTGIEVKEAGYSDLGEQVFQELVSRSPNYSAGHYELAVVQRFGGRHHDAIRSAKKAVALEPQDTRYRMLLGQMLHSLGAHPEGKSVLAAVEPKSAEEAQQLAVLRNYGEYLREFPRGRAHHLLNEVRDAYYWMDIGQTAEQINRAIDERRGFSLIRLGDGEGAFARISREDEAKYETLYGWMRRDWATALYGAQFDPKGTGYESLVETLMDTALEQDVIGVPYHSWIDHEYNISSTRGVPCCLNVHRGLLAEPSRRPLLCDQRIHVELHYQGYVEPILRRVGSIGVISCHSQLPEIMKARFGLSEVELFKIPGEKYTEGMRDAEQMQGDHFPFVFWDIIRRLSVPHHGRVFMIAAGTLAKYYAATIKKHGGIALDLGSLVDGWLNISSRPGYDASLKI